VAEPLFYYYGRKKQIARHYAPPSYQTIVEPFAGAASYSLHGSNWRRQVILVERDHRVAAIWRWLIEEATPSSILALPDLHAGEKSSEFLHIIHAATKMAFKYKTIKATPVLERNWEISRRVMAASVHKVKHWSLIEGDYTRVPNIEATWFLDPPYKASPGQGYDHGSSDLDYEALANWALERKGQLIFCEGEFGDYLPFRPLLQLAGIAGKRSREVVYYGADERQCQPSLFGELASRRSFDQQTTPSTLSKTST
jgi:site-specific DNA-adenine methylase